MDWLHTVRGELENQVYFQVADLLNLEVDLLFFVLRAVRRQPERPPDAVHAGRRDRGPAGQLGPVRRPLGDLLQGPHDHFLHLSVGDRARYSRPGLVTQPVQPPGQEPGNTADRAAPDASRAATAMNSAQSFWRRPGSITKPCSKHSNRRSGEMDDLQRRFSGA
jgi:hypothetical protein